MILVPKKVSLLSQYRMLISSSAAWGYLQVVLLPSEKYETYFSLWRTDFFVLFQVLSIFIQVSDEDSWRLITATEKLQELLKDRWMDIKP